MAPSADLRIDGVLESWNDDRGFGFLALPYGGKPVFVHIRAFERLVGRPVVGHRYSFLIEQAKDDKFRASRVRPLGETPSPARARTVRRPPRPTSAAWLAPLGFAALYVVFDLLWGIPIWVALGYLLLSAISFGQYAIDKRAAQNNRWRVSEAALQLTSLIGGWPGSIAAQQLLRHKTRKASFLANFWLAVAGNIIAFVAVVVFASGNLAETLLG